jgi:hypothetical protein
MGVPLGGELAIHAGLEPRLAVLKHSHEALIKERAGMVTSCVRLINLARFA